MKQWSYIYVRVTAGVEADRLSVVLNELGMSGWEAFMFTGDVIWMKRAVT